jgi:hypothetical protein
MVISYFFAWDASYESSFWPEFKPKFGMIGMIG